MFAMPCLPTPHSKLRESGIGTNDQYTLSAGGTFLMCLLMPLGKLRESGREQISFQ